MERLIAAAYRDGSRRGLMIKTLFLTGARVSEFVHIRVEDLHLDERPAPDPPDPRQGPGQPLRADPAGPGPGAAHPPAGPPPGLSVREQSPHALRRADGADDGEAVRPRRRASPSGSTPICCAIPIATILLDSGQVPIDQVRKFLGHLHLSTTQIYAETSLRALGENYVRALSDPELIRGSDHHGPTAIARHPRHTAGGGD